MSPPLETWLAAARPKTLPAAVVPVIVGLALASRSFDLRVDVAITTLLATLLIQIGTNLANDYYDFLSGADTDERLGPMRVTQAGLVSPTTVRRAAFAVLGVAALCGLHLISVGGWPIFAIGVAALVCALAYTGGPFPLGYNGLGDLFVFLFFGLIAVTGTDYLHSGSFRGEALLVAIPVACLATAILVVNNLRDRVTDSGAGKRTLAVRFGELFTRREYAALLATAYLALGPIAAWVAAGALLALLSLPLAATEFRAFTRREGTALNESLAGTARLHLVFGALLAAGLAFGP